MTGRIEKTVFISYRRANKPWALFIYQNLTHHGYDVFIDFQNINSGNFETAILDNIRARAHFIIVLTPSALERCKEPSDWLRREIETALDEKRNIVPLMIEGFDFGNPLVKNALTGKLSVLSSINGLRIPDDFPFEAMDRLRERYLNIALTDVALPNLPEKSQEIATAEKSAANNAPSVEKVELVAQKWYEQGYVSQETNKIDQAIEFYTQAIKLNPKFFQAYNNRGVLYRVKGEHNRAIRDFNEVIRQKPNSVEAYINRGTIHIDKKDLDNAIVDFNEAIRINPNIAMTFANRGAAYRSKGEINKALSDFDKAIHLDPNDAAFYYNRGNARRDLRDMDGAISDYNTALFIDPDYLEAYGNRGLSHYDNGNWDEAIADYNKLIHKNPNDEVAYYNRGNAQSAKGKNLEAIQDYETAIQLKPDFSEAYYSRGTSFQLIGDFEKSIRDYQEAIRLKPNYGLARSSLVNVLRKVERFTEADQQMSLARELITQETEYNQACFESICGNTERALELLKIGLEKNQSRKEWVRQDPDFENIRDDPRFKELIGD